jgi:hypothetical protein
VIPASEQRIADMLEKLDQIHGELAGDDARGKSVFVFLLPQADGPAVSSFRVGGKSVFETVILES